ncbi:hypothetical protein BH11PLA2_BH11PLA2_43000 [soil metagenome]
MVVVLSRTLTGQSLMDEALASENLVARPWRLRHKLIFGLALVVGCIALLLGGALFGLSAFVDASNTTSHKLVLIQNVVNLRDSVHMMSLPPDANTADPTIPQRQRERVHIHHYVEQARQHTATYRRLMDEGHGRADSDPDDGIGERNLIDSIDANLVALDKAVEETRHGVSTGFDRRVIDEPAVRAHYDRLSLNSQDLFQTNKTHIDQANERAGKNHHRGRIIVVTATATAVVLLLTLLYYFRVWIFRPIKALQRGVARVHRGEFDHPISIHSRDELEELANEFNAMTARLRDIYKDLANQVNERSRQLVRSERMVSVGYLAAGVAHEINNPLQSISLYSDALEGRLKAMASRLPAEQAQEINNFLGIIQSEAFRCKDITKKLLDFSRAGEQRRERSDLGKLIEDVIQVARPLPNCRNKRIEFAPTYLVAAISPPDLKSVVLNLIVNALDSMDEGGVLAVALEIRGENAAMVFRDTGCGMTEEVLNNIFEPFFTRNRTGNGTGLGLSISHQIIDQHGGSIVAASEGPGRGSTFTVTLPLKAAEKELPPAEHPDVLQMPDFAGRRAAA